MYQEWSLKVCFKKDFHNPIYYLPLNLWQSNHKSTGPSQCYNTSSTFWFNICLLVFVMNIAINKWVNFYSACPLKQQFVEKHVSWHIIQILSQPVFVLTPLCWMLSGESANTYLIVFSLTRLGLEPRIYPTWCMHTNHYTTDAKKRALFNAMAISKQPIYQ
jgi:hypothetical protein